MKLAAVLLAAFTLSAFSALADENADMETLYLGLCQPGSALEKKWSAADRKEALGLRREFQGFLKNPEPVVAGLRAALSRPLDLSDQLSVFFTYAFTCEMNNRIVDKIIARGCRSERGEKLDGQRAHELCKPVAEEIRRHGKPSEEPGQE